MKKPKPARRSQPPPAIPALNGQAAALSVIADLAANGSTLAIRQQAIQELEQLMLEAAVIAART